MVVSGLIGREHPAGVLRGAVERVAAGRGGLVMVTGEPGIGKSALVAEAVGAARSGGAVVAGGACWEGGGAPGLWPWVQVVRSLRRDIAADRWAAAGREAGGGLEVLLGERPGEAGGEVFGVFDAVASLLVAVSRDRPLVVVLEDLHWADAASVRLLEFVAQRTWFERLLVVGTYRDAEAAEGAGTAGLMALKATAVTLTGLAGAEVAALVERVTGMRAPLEVAAEIGVRSGGNPFLVEQLARLWQGGGSLEAVPLGARAVLERRLGRLAPEVTGVLTAAAVLGREFDAAFLALCAGGPVAGRLDAAVAAGLVRAGDGGRYAFTHDLVRETLYAGLGADAAAERHAAVVRAWEGSPGAAGGLEAADRARHAYLAAPRIGAGSATGYLMAAGRAAEGRLAFEEAAGHFGRALELAGPGGARRRVEVLLALGTARHHALDQAGAAAVFGEAVALVRELDDPAVLARAALTLYGLGTTMRRPLLDFLHEAHRRLLRAGGGGSTDEAAVDLTGHAAALAREQGDDEALAFALLTRLGAVWEPGSTAERLDISGELEEVARRRGEEELVLQARAWRIGALLEAGDARFVAEQRAFAERAARSAALPQRHEALVSGNVAATLAGRFDEARELIQAAWELGEQPHITRVELRFLQLWAVELLQGRWERVEALLAEMDREGFVHRGLLRAVTAVQRGDADAAVPHLTRVMASGGEYLRWLRPLWLRFQAQAAALSGDVVLCRAAREALRPLLGRWAVTATVTVDGPMVLWSAVLDAACGDTGAAVAGFTAAAEAADRLGARPWAVEARWRLAAVLVERGETAEAAALLEPLEREAAALGMLDAEARARALRAGPAGGGGESGRVFRFEGGVWTLAFAGRTVHLPDSKGLRDLHALLGAAGRDVAAVRLLTPAGGEVVVAARGLGGDDVLDETAKARYRRRLAGLDEEIDRAAGLGRDERVAELDAERAALIEELRRAAGLGGRTRRLGDEAERARKAVTNRIRDALRRLEDRHPELAGHLREAVSTGAVCSYRPAAPVKWSL